MSEGAAGFRDPKVLIPFLLVTLVWSSTWIVIKDQIGTVPSPWSVTYRFGIAAAAMFVIAAMSGASLNIGRGGQALALLIGIPQFALNFNFVYAAEHHITSGLVAVLFALLVVPNALFARLFFGQPVGGRFLAGSAIAMAGVALLFAQEIRASAAASREAWIGVGLALIAVLSASSANVMQLVQGVRSRPLPAILAWAMLYGTLLDAGIAFALHGPPVIESRPGYWLGTLYLGLVGSALTFPLYFALIRRIGPGKAAYSSVLIPILAMAISTVAEGYRWSALAIAGGTLALIGLVIALRAGQPAAAGAGNGDRTRITSLEG